MFRTLSMRNGGTGGRDELAEREFYYGQRCALFRIDEENNKVYFNIGTGKPFAFANGRKRPSERRSSPLGGVFAPPTVARFVGKMHRRKNRFCRRWHCGNRRKNCHFGRHFRDTRNQRWFHSDRFWTAGTLVLAALIDFGFILTHRNGLLVFAALRYFLPTYRVVSPACP